VSPRQCCACRREACTSVVRFPLLKTGYPLGAKCHAAWRQEAQSLGGAIYNPATLQVAFSRWLESRKEKAAQLVESAPPGRNDHAERIRAMEPKKGTT